MLPTLLFAGSAFFLGVATGLVLGLAIDLRAQRRRART